MKKYSIGKMPATMNQAKDAIYYLRCKLSSNPSTVCKDPYPNGFTTLEEAHAQINNLIEMINRREERDHSCRAVDCLASTRRPVDITEPQGVNGGSEPLS